MSTTTAGDYYTGIVINVPAKKLSYTILRLRASATKGRYFYDATVNNVTNFRTAVVTHGVKIIDFSGRYGDIYRNELRAEYKTNQYITQIGQSYVEPKKNHLCNEVVSCAVDYVEVAIDGVDHGIIVYEYVRGMNLIYFFNHMTPKLEQNPLTKRAAYFAYVEFVFKMAISICHIVHVLHTFGIFHNDIKPDNFVITYDESEEHRPIPNNFKILAVDFGLSCAVEVPIGADVPIPRTTRCMKDERGFMRYGGTQKYLDPRATSKSAERPPPTAMNIEPEDTFASFEYFETYSVAKTINAYLIDRYFANDTDQNVLVFLRELVKDMTGSFAYRKNIAIYEGFLKRALEVVQAAHMVEFGELPINLLDEEFDSLSASGSEVKLPQRASNNDDDNTQYKLKNKLK